jgi:hypothetical protein
MTEIPRFRILLVGRVCGCHFGWAWIDPKKQSGVGKSALINAVFGSGVVVRVQ